MWKNEIPRRKKYRVGIKYGTKQKSYQRNGRYLFNFACKYNVPGDTIRMDLGRIVYSRALRKKCL